MLTQAAALHGHIIIVDIDGTLVPSGKSAESLSQLVREWVYQLKLRNRVYLCSNKKVHKRNMDVAIALEVGYLKSEFRKPSRKALAGLHIDCQRVVVVGDKFLTDGLFAKHIGAKFIKVPRIVTGDESLYDRFHHACDDIVYSFYKMFSA